MCVLSLSHAATCFGNYTFEGTNWTVSWTVTGRNITFGMFGPAGGWLGIGFSETPDLDSVSLPPLSHSTHYFHWIQTILVEPTHPSVHFSSYISSALVDCERVSIACSLGVHVKQLNPAARLHHYPNHFVNVT